MYLRANRRKKLAKALERQARKLRAKGIAVDLESLRAEYLQQHQVTTESDLEDDDPQIDVVGDADTADDSKSGIGSVRSASAISPPLASPVQPPPPPAAVQPLLLMPKRRDSLGESVESGESDSQPSPKQTMLLTSNQKRNSFSIDSLLYNRS